MKHTSAKNSSLLLKSGITSVLILLLNAFSTSAQPLFDWAKKFGNTSSEIAFAITADATGNSYTTGTFRNTVDFDPGPGTFNLVSSGSADDIFIIKLDALGNFVWAKKIGGTQNDYGYSITADLSGNIYITGVFSGTVDFDPNIGVSNLTAAAGGSSYILKLDASGNFVWARAIVGNSGVVAYNITLDNLNNVLITGFYGGTADFNPEAGVFNITSVGLNDFFAVKLSSAGSFVWAKSWGGTSDDFGATSIRTDAAGDVYCSGYFRNTADFDPSVNTVNLTSSGLSDIYVLKLSSAGNFIWAKQVGGALNNDECNASAMDNNNNLYLTGSFGGTADFDPNAGVANLTATVQDIFVLKLDLNGNFVWAKNVGGALHSSAYSIATDANGAVYTTGYFQGTVDFNPNSGTNNLTSFGGADIYVLKLDALGNYVWAIQKGGANSEEAFAIVVDAGSNIYSAGLFRDTADFDFGSGVFNLVSSGGGTQDIFIDKAQQCIAPPAPSNQTPVSNQSICSGLSSTLIAAATGTISWYASPTSTNALGSGSVFTTPALSAGTYTYYAEAATCTLSAARIAITLTVHPSPTIIVNSGSVCAGNAFTITPSGANTYTISGGASVVSPTTNTSYSITGTSAQGCSSANTAISHVTVNALPVVSATTNSSLICTGQSVSLTATGAVGYVWNTSQLGNSIVVSPTITSNYTVTGTNALGCSATFVITQSVSACTDIHSLNTHQPEVKIYPNPSNGIFTISVMALDATIDIYNSVGQRIVSTPPKTIYTTLDLSSYPSGIYLIKVKSDSWEVVQKLIKQ